MRLRQSMRWEEARGAWRRKVSWEREFEGSACRCSAGIKDLGPQRVRSPYDFAGEEIGEVDRRVVVFLDEYRVPMKAGGRRGFDPLTAADLLLRFVRLGVADEAELVGFYREFGFLGDSQKLKPYGWEGWGDLGGEPVWWVRHKARELGALMEVYHALQRRDAKELRMLLGPVGMSKGKEGRPGFTLDLWIDDYMFRAGAGLPPASSEYYPSLTRPSALYNNEVREPATAGCRPSRLRDQHCYRLAELLISEWVNLHLAEVRRVVGLPQPESWRDADAVAERAARPFVPRWRCVGLLGAVYVHFYDLITGNGELQRCLGCGDLYPVPVVQRGRPKVYCGRRCQNAANKRAQSGATTPTKTSRRQR